MRRRSLVPVTILVLALLPCTTIQQQTQPASWLCFDPKETCDNADNNCQSGIDENVLKFGNPAHCPLAETCNAQDDDCDGQIDEIAACNGCVQSPEICDGCDNDCDGLVDEGFAQPTVVYVDDDFSILPGGTDPAGPGQAIGCDSFATIQAGINAVAPGGTVNVAAGTYVEDVSVTKTVSILGAGAGSSIVSGPIGGGSAIDKPASCEAHAAASATSNTASVNSSRRRLLAIT